MNRELFKTCEPCQFGKVGGKEIGTLMFTEDSFFVHISSSASAALQTMEVSGLTNPLVAFSTFSERPGSLSCYLSCAQFRDEELEDYDREDVAESTVATMRSALDDQDVAALSLVHMGNVRRKGHSQALPSLNLYTLTFDHRYAVTAYPLKGNEIDYEDYSQKVSWKSDSLKPNFLLTTVWRDYLLTRIRGEEPSPFVDFMVRKIEADFSKIHP